MQNSSEYPDHLSILSRALWCLFFDNLSRKSCISLPSILHTPITLGRVVRKPINTNPGLKADRGFNFCCIKTFLAYVKRSVI